MLAFVGNVLSHFGQKIQCPEDLVVVAARLAGRRWPGGEALMQTTFSTASGYNAKTGTLRVSA
jgi:hypothetical protein